MPLPDYGETLRPDFAVRELDPQDDASALAAPGASPRARRGLRSCRPRGSGRLEASAHGRMERLLRQTGVPAGLLFNGRTLRLLSAPRGESSGWLDFHVADMVQTAGRPISTALRLLLSQTRLLSLPRPQRLAALLEDSRKFQNEVSERLAEQVLHALYELLRGFQAAHDASKGELLREPLAEHPDEVYRALLTVILRLVFLLYAEERDMLPEDETFLRYYSLAGLYERLREDAALFPDTMDQRYGAWAQLLVLFRMIHDGAESGAMRLPKRHGVLFDPDRFKFLEGRPAAGARQIHERIEPPLVPDGTIYRALEKLLVLDGERISYRALDVEQIGSVYETMMGFRLETATGRSVAIKARRSTARLRRWTSRRSLREPAAKRAKWLQDRADRKLTDKVKKAVDRGRDARGPARRAPAGDRLLPPRPTSCRRVRWCCSRVKSDAARARTTRRARSPSQSCARRSNRSSRACAAKMAGRLGPSKSSTSRSATRRWARGRSSSRPAASSATRSSRPGTPTTRCPRSRPTRTR